MANMHCLSCSTFSTCVTWKCGAACTHCVDDIKQEWWRSTYDWRRLQSTETHGLHTREWSSAVAEVWW